MGIIQKQATRSTLINFLGAGFGSITRLIMPFFLERSQIGILALLDAKSGVFVIALNLGFNLILKKLFPKYRDENNGHAGFLILGIFLTLIGTLIGLIVFYTLQGVLFDDLSDDSLLKSFIFLIPIIIFFKILFVNLDGYARMLFHTVIGSFLNGLVAKIVLLLALVFYVYSFISFTSFVYFYCVALSLPGLVILLYSFFITKKIKLPSKRLLNESKKIKTYILFGILSGASYSIIQYIDVLMIDGIIQSESEVGVYSIMFFASVLIAIPAKGVNRISSVIVAESWKINDIENIQKVYSKSAVNLLLIGGFLFVVGWTCIDFALVLLPKYEYGKYVFFFLGVGRVIELGTGVNVEIIDTSEKYKFNTYFNVLLAVLAIVFNVVLISSYGIVGAAIASMLAMTTINSLRALFLYKTFRLSPFDTNYFKAALLVLLFLGLVSFFDFYNTLLIFIIIKVSILTVMFWVLVVKLNLSSDINTWITKIKTKYIK